MQLSTSLVIILVAIMEIIKLGFLTMVKWATCFHLNTFIFHIVAAEKSITDSPTALLSASHI